MEKIREIENVAIVGMGALGVLYGSMIQDALGEDAVRFVMDEARIKKYADLACFDLNKPGIENYSGDAEPENYAAARVLVNGKEYRFRCVSSKDAGPADLVIVAVKGPQLNEALDVMAPCVKKDSAAANSDNKGNHAGDENNPCNSDKSPRHSNVRNSDNADKSSAAPQIRINSESSDNTIIMSVLNGISSEDIIAERYGAEHLIYTVAQGMDAMKFGGKLTFSKPGQLIIGIKDESQRHNLMRVSKFLERCGMPYTLDPDILRRIWGKFMLNVGVNQTCMVFDCNYGDVRIEGSRERETMLSAMREVIAISEVCGINLTEADLAEYDALEKTLAPEGLPSMAQDRVAKRFSEVDMFAKTVIEYGKKYGVPTPANDWLYKEVKKIEAEY